MTSKITKSASGKRCTMRLPGVCNHDPATTIWSHINSVRWGSGRGHKSPDICGAYTCSDCGDAIDGRRLKDKNGERLDKEFVRLCAYEAHFESLMILWEEGII